PNGCLYEVSKQSKIGSSIFSLLKKINLPARARNKPHERGRDNYSQNFPLPQGRERDFCYFII
ncbi:MAG: hypothetical protein ACI4JY_00440, partial [Oscillospiraceae bacterium]